jgi:hypothetical protein
MFGHAKKQERQGPGAIPIFEKPKNTRRLYSTTNTKINIEYAVLFILPYLQDLAYGTRKLTTSYGEILELPQLSLNKSLNEIRTAYYNLFDQPNFQDNFIDEEFIPQPLCETHFDEVVKDVSGGKKTNLTALDSVLWKTCYENFKNLQFLIDIITVGKLEERKRLNKLSNDCDEFLRCVYADHLFPESQCPCHSYNHAFEDIQSIPRNKICNDCNIVKVIEKEITDAINSANLNPRHESKEELYHYFQARIMNDMEIFRGHIIRKTHESHNFEKVLETLDDSTSVVIIHDEE